MPTRSSSAIFRGKATLLTLRRAIQDVLTGIKRHPCERLSPSSLAASSLSMPSPAYPHVVAESRTPLYTETNLAERALQLGKVQNLRRALRHLHGMVIPAGELFSFWKQVGRATTHRGYVAGRQLREGCLFPAIGGGLCQLSNALYDVALQASCEIVERHPHTRFIPGSAAARNRDAAIAWNYIDLRFRPHTPLCLKVVLTRDELIVRFCAGVTENERLNRQEDREESISSLHGTAGFVPIALHMATVETRTVLKAQEHSCVTCGVHACFRHDAPEVETLRAHANAGTAAGRTAYLVDEYMPELAAYVHEQCTDNAVLMLPLDGLRWKQPRYRWQTEGYAHVLTATLPTLRRAYHARALAGEGEARRLAQLEGAERLAETYARRLPWDTEHIVVTQSLLPYLWRDGHLGGRTFDVLMTRLPIETLQNRLDEAFAAHPDRTLLHDFRASPHLARWEMEALRTARRLITPHTDLAAQFTDQWVRLQWQPPHVEIFPLNGVTPGSLIAFPGPTHARKGAYELRAAARALHLEVLLLGSDLEGADFWQDVQTCRLDRSPGTDWLNGVGVVVQPARVEEQPRRLLEAIARGVPIIATSACGLGTVPGVTTIPMRDENALREAIVHCLFPHNSPCASHTCSPKRPEYPNTDDRNFNSDFHESTTP